MTTYQPKTYQTRLLESVETYFRACYELLNPRLAFNAVTERLWGKGLAYNPIAGLPDDMPYFCPRVPTGGGKTWLAARSVLVANTHLLHNEHSHPNYAALRETNPLTVIDLVEAKSIGRATLDTSTTVIVATVHAFRREDTECLKVYASNSALMHHFDGLAAELLAADAHKRRT